MTTFNGTQHDRLADQITGKSKHASFGGRESSDGAPSGSLAQSTLSSLFQNFKTGFPLFLADFFSLNLTILISAGLASLCTGVGINSLIAPSFALNSLVFLLLYAFGGLYPGVGLNPIVELKQMVLGTLAGGVILGAFSFLQGKTDAASVILFVGIPVLGVFLVTLSRCLMRDLLSQYEWWSQPALVIGHGPSAVKLMEKLSRRGTSGIRPVGTVGEFPSGDLHVDWLGTIDQIDEIAAKHRVHWALIPTKDCDSLRIKEIVSKSSTSIRNLILVPDAHGFPNMWSRTRDIEGSLGIHVRERLLCPSSQIFKRAFDLICVIGGLIVFSPVFLGLFAYLFVCMKMKSPGPIFYSQPRVGKNGKHFRLWKFRTMVVDADAALKKYLADHPEVREEWEVTQKFRNDPRIIPGVGNFLRKSSLDELPQLWNVLTGEMSLVGPRPFMPNQEGSYGEVLASYKKVKPGITGLWQISGRNTTSFEKRLYYDDYYVRNWSVWFDFFILGRTVKTVITREGAF